MLSNFSHLILCIHKLLAHVNKLKLRNYLEHKNNSMRILE